MVELSQGTPAPDFSLPASNNTTVKLSDFRGKKVVVYFYPKDNTPGCTTEACQFRDAHDDFAGLDAVVLGISADNLDSHDRFIEKYQLPFLLLADEDHTVTQQYGAWREKLRFGKKYFGIIRSTFVIDREGLVARSFYNVKVANHAEEVREVLSDLP